MTPNSGWGMRLRIGRVGIGGGRYGYRAGSLEIRGINRSGLSGLLR